MPILASEALLDSMWKKKSSHKMLAQVRIEPLDL